MGVARKIGKSFIILCRARGSAVNRRVRRSDRHWKARAQTSNRQLESKSAENEDSVLAKTGDESRWRPSAAVIVERSLLWVYYEFLEM